MGYGSIALMLLRIVDDLQIARATVLRREPAENLALPAPVRDRIREVFGVDLSADLAVAKIIADVRANGDAALRRFGLAFDGQSIDSLEVSTSAIDQAWRTLPTAGQDALALAADRIRRFHERSLPRTWLDFDEDSAFGQVFRAIDRVGIYAPGGRAVYPSTVLMTAIPARV
ncbi:MAG: histidinol dehydrogenase, partial [Chloroflexota bacterium]